MEKSELTSQPSSDNVIPMAQDRFIRFKDDAYSADDLRIFVEDFCGKTAHLYWTSQTLMIHLDGKGSDPFARLVNRQSSYRDERWIEIRWEPRKLNIITREQDPFTNAIANTMAKMLTRYKDGKLDMEEDK